MTIHQFQTVGPALPPQPAPGRIGDPMPLRAPTGRSKALQEADNLVNGDRNTHYGTPTENFTNIAALWSVQLGHKLNAPITAGEVSALMISLKLARSIASPNKRDHWVDMAGYAAIGAEIAEDSK